MANPPQSPDERFKELTFNTPGHDDDPLTYRLKDPNDPNSPWVIKVCIDSPAPVNLDFWKREARDIGGATADMQLQTRLASEQIQKMVPNSAGGRLFEFEYVSDPKDADISVYSGAPQYGSAFNWGGKQSSWVGPDGRVHKEIMINPDQDGWKRDPNHTPTHTHNPTNPHSIAGYLMLHEFCHAMGLKHPGDRGNPLIDYGNTPGFTRDDTIMSYKPGQYNHFSLRALDKRALQYIYMQTDAVDANFKDAPSQAIFNDPRDIAVNASDAVGHTVYNEGNGRIVVKLTQAQYDNRIVEARKTPENNDYFALIIKAADGTPKTIHLETDAQLLVRGSKPRVETIATFTPLSTEKLAASVLTPGQAAAEKTPLSTSPTSPQEKPLARDR